MHARKLGRGTLLAAAAMGGLCLSAIAAAQEGRQNYNLEAVSLADALIAVGRQADIEIIYSSELIAGRRVAPLRGTYSARQAIDRLLDGTNLVAEFRDGKFVIRGRTEASADDALGIAATDDIIVTGTRIRGSTPTSPVISATRDDIERRGLSDLGAYIRDLPQNYNGGQNPGVVGGNQGSENLNSSSALNLRGLGPDATLTLINGHRVAYDGVVQGVDISAIPLAAIDRLEIVADGSSGLYGSDAVGGVANIILRKSYDGLWTSARVGFTTDGGGAEQQLSAVTGTSWAGGGVLATADYKHATAITAGQRPYADTVNASATLIPGLKQFSSVISGHQQLTDGVHFQFDGQYSRRTSLNALPLSVASDVRFFGNTFDSKVRTFSITPSVLFELPGSWELTVAGTYGESSTDGRGVTYQNGSVASRRRVPYRNSIRNFEAYAEGPVLRLPGGDARLVVGAGYRVTSLDAQSTQTLGSVTTQILSFDREHKIGYAFGELSLPLIGPERDVPLISRLRMTAALRYEDYGSVGDVASPRLGLIYSPHRSVDLKFSWGKSFKAPTLYNQHRGYEVILFPASFFGPSAAPEGSTVAYTAGANADLRPEKARTWTATAAIEPEFAPGLRFEASYFNLHYSNRVANPITSIFGALSNPIYSHLITLSPTPAQIQARAAGSLFGLENFTDGPYDPANVYALVEGVLQNTARQRARGADLSASYAADVGPRDKLTLQGSATYLESDRELLDGLPPVDLAGTIFNPPHWRAQGGLSWDHGELSISSFANYIGDTRDSRAQPDVRVKSFFSVDLAGQWKSSALDGPLRGASLFVSVSNLFNERPSKTRSRSVGDPSYDSTNYPATGRAISFTITKAW